MTTTAADSQAAPPAGRFWFLKRSWPAVRVAIAGFLPCPDLPARWQMRHEAVSLIGLQEWPGMNASSEDVAQLAMLRPLDLQKQVHRLVLLRQREASVMMARSGVETLLLGLYCMRVPDAVARLHAGNVKALGDTLAYLEEAGIAPASVIRECARGLGEPAKAHLTPWEMVQAIDVANDKKAARSIYGTDPVLGPVNNRDARSFTHKPLHQRQAEPRTSPRHQGNVILQPSHRVTPLPHVVPFAKPATSMAQPLRGSSLPVPSYSPTLPRHRPCFLLSRTDEFRTGAGSVVP